MDNKAPDAFRTISEVADELDLPQHVLRFWESRFHEIKPMKRGGGGAIIAPTTSILLRGIRHLLYGEGYTIRGVQRILREQGSKFVQVVWQEGAPQPPHGVVEEEEFVEEARRAEDLLDEERGLRGRLSSLIGRDLGDRQDDAAARIDPPLDRRARSAHRSGRPRDPRAARGICHASTASRQAVVAQPSRAGRRPGRDDLRKLHAALHELAECRKLIDAAVTRPH